MFNIKRLLAAVPANYPAAESIAAQLWRFSPEQADTYLGWRFVRDHGEENVRYPNDPIEQLRLIADTVKRECARIYALRDDFGWHGPLSNPEVLLAEFGAQVNSTDSQHFDRANDLLDSLVVIAMTSGARRN